jgi:hypothetical protein
VLAVASRDCTVTTWLLGGAAGVEAGAGADGEGGAVAPQALTAAEHAAAATPAAAAAAAAAAEEGDDDVAAAGTDDMDAERMGGGGHGGGHGGGGGDDADASMSSAATAPSASASSVAAASQQLLLERTATAAQAAGDAAAVALGVLPPPPPLRGPLHFLRGCPEPPAAVAVSPSLDCVAAACPSAGLALFSLLRGRLMRRVPSAPGELLVLSREGFACVWDPRSRVIRAVSLNGALVAAAALPSDEGRITAMTVSADGASLAWHACGMLVCAASDMHLSLFLSLFLQGARW